MRNNYELEGLEEISTQINRLLEHPDSDQYIKDNLDVFKMYCDILKSQGFSNQYDNIYFKLREVLLADIPSLNIIKSLYFIILEQWHQNENDEVVDIIFEHLGKNFIHANFDDMSYIITLFGQVQYKDHQRFIIK